MLVRKQKTTQCNNIEDLPLNRLRMLENKVITGTVGHNDGREERKGLDMLRDEKLHTSYSPLTIP
jgi:hypothetical protein